MPDISQEIAALVMDVDGVLTDGTVIISDDGTESRSYDVRDGIGIRMLHEAGLLSAFCTGGGSQGVRKRAQMLGITALRLNAANKAEAFSSLCSELGLAASKVAYIGDDVVDIPPLRAAGAAFTVPDAPRPVRQYADYVTRAPGGAGAVREVCEMLVAAAARRKAV